MSDSPANDYAIERAVAELLQLLTTCPGEEREAALVDLARRVGPRQLARLFAQFIGLANSVAADEQRQTIGEELAAIARPEPAP
ncbi:hypothetical protein V3391_06760 [Luteimonas sp. SMYT11W]|uniref:Uncharacterized protein n=1 Tax=Luteimonas flava TaxID=3115822 RepID=A0ABU7WD76_9GAMM